MPLVINSLGRRHTHARTPIPTIRTGSILRKPGAHQQQETKFFIWDDTALI